MKIASLYLLFISLVFSSCLKENKSQFPPPSNNDNTAKAVSITLSTSGENFRKVFIDKETTEQTINLIPITLAGGLPAETDLLVVLDTSSAKVNAYNAAHGTAFSHPDPFKYSIVSKTVLIPKGQNIGYLQIRLIPNNFLGGTFALGFSIITVSNGYSIAANNANNAVAAFTLMNPFEGNYTNTGMRYNYVGGPHPYSGTGPVPSHWVTSFNLAANKFGSTIDQYTTEFDFANVGSATPYNYRYIVTVPAGTTGTANVTVPLSFSTNFLSLMSNINVLISTYNPSTKTFHFVITYFTQPGNLGNQRIVDETLVKI